MPFRCLFHLHTRRSFDSWLSPAKILATARAMNVDVLIATDHNTLAGAKDLKNIARGNPKFVVAGVEYQTEKGDVIGLFLKNEILSRSSNQVIAEIRAQDGLVVLPHPYKAHTLDEELLSQIDLIEVHNSRCSKSENSAACELAQKLKRPFIGGADAHCAGELRAVLNHFSAELPCDEAELKQRLLHGARTVESRSVSGIFRPYSQVIKAIKTGDPLLFLSQAKRLGVTFLREALR